MKKTGWIILIAVIAVVGLIGILLAGTYNRLVDLDTAVQGKNAEIQTQLQRRADLIPNFVATVKGYSDYEQSTLTAITQARAAVGQAQGAQEQAEASEQLDRAISIWVNAVTEAYPDLKANTQYIALQDELAGTENRIAQARRDYNEAVTAYNAAIRKFPKSIFASMLGFQQAELFQADAGAEQVPTVSF